MRAYARLTIKPPSTPQIFQGATSGIDKAANCCFTPQLQPVGARSRNWTKRFVKSMKTCYFIRLAKQAGFRAGIVDSYAFIHIRRNAGWPANRLAINKPHEKGA
jgi:hypothetical protein